MLASGFCHMHDPERQAELATVRRAGGHARSTAARAAKHLPRHLADVQTQLLELMEAVRTGKAEPPVLTAWSGAVSRLLDLARFSLEVGETAELEQRLAELEAAYAAHRGRA